MSHECSYCEKSYASKSSLTRHIREKHPEELSREHECPTCGRDDFASEKGMKQHHARAHGETVREYKLRNSDGPIHECPNCDRRFKTRESLAQHHWQIHSETLSGYERRNSGGIECPSCDRDDFESRQAVASHHVQAHDESIAGVEVECTWCGDSFRKTASHAKKTKRSFCPDKDCQSKWRSENSKVPGHPCYRPKNRVEVPCTNCGKPIASKPSTADGGNRFCGRECYAEYRSTEYVAEDHPRWNGGYKYYGANWPTQRLKAMVRDQARCQGCGLTDPENQQKHGRSLTAHHITPLEEFRQDNGGIDYSEANALDNLVIVCDDCHPRFERVAPLRPVTAD